MSSSPETVAVIRERLEAHGQEHILQRLDGLRERDLERLTLQLERLDFDLLGTQRAQIDAPPAEQTGLEIAPAEVFPLRRDATLEARADEARQRGEAWLAEGKVGFLVVAGGQASRLGYDGPKGAFGLGPVSGCSLFEYHAHRLMALERRHGCELTWYVMTSPANDADTRAFFREQDHFGWEAERVFFFQQSMLPALDLHGRMLMQAPDSLFLAPGGHGGTFAALADSGALEHARERGVETFSYFQVDNPLVLPGDPLFIGLHTGAAASMSSKVVSKRDAGEKVGIIGRVNGKLGCIEYSDLPAQLRDATDASGELLYSAGNIAMHLIQRAFVEELTSTGLELPWHLARKQLSVLDEHGKRVDVTGVKFERFVFDALGHSPRSVTLEVDRAREFSPVKNKSGQDSPASARHDLQRLHADWCRRAGLPLPEPGESGVPAVEIDPLVAEDLEGLLAAAPLEPQVSERGYLYR